MDGTLPTRPELLNHTLSWIEQHLNESLTLDAIAARAGFSSYHFSRLFTARMGHSVMSHVRGRRLVKAAQRLLADPDLKLIDLAFDCGFESQEAFTRAFKRTFGVAPGRFRSGFAVAPAEGQFPMRIPDQLEANVVQLPDFVRRERFVVAGFSRRFDEATKSSIPQLWAQLIGRLPFDGQEANWATYGVVWSANKLDGSFSYMAGVGLKPGAAIPAGLECKELPKASYVVFRITLTGAPVHPQLKAAMGVIWGELIPASGLRIADGPDFELYDSQFTPNRPGAVIDFHVPVKV